MIRFRQDATYIFLFGLLVHPMLMGRVVSSGVNDDTPGSKGLSFVVIAEDNATDISSPAPLNDPDGSAVASNGGEGTGTTFVLFDENTPAEPGNSTTTTTPADTTNDQDSVPNAVATDAPTTESTREEVPKEPFIYKYIYIIGGGCTYVQSYYWDGDEYTAPNEDAIPWHSRYFAGGVGAFGDWEETYPGSTVRHICMDDDNVDKYYDANFKGFVREFHLSGLRQVEEEVGEEGLKDTLVITLGEALESDWTPLADLLRKGLAFFHGGYTGESVSMNLTEYGLKADEVTYIYFILEAATAAERAGIELCRLKGKERKIKIGKLTWDARPDTLPRIEAALEAYKAECPDVEVQEVWDIKFDDAQWNKTMQSALLFKELPDVVLTFSDFVAEPILKIAEDTLSSDEYARFSTTGWDDMFPRLLSEKKILTTVDQMVFYPKRGLWELETKLVRMMQAEGLRSTKDIQEALQIGDTVEILSAVAMVSCDTTGFLLETLMSGYEPNSLPTTTVQVSTGLHDVSITEMIPFEGKFEGVIWLEMSWIDPRLAWNPFVHSGTLQINPEDIWTPPLFFQNEFSSDELYVSPAMITYEGNVTLRKNVMATFLCPTTERLKGFPFDVYNCEIKLMAPESVILDASYGFEVVASDPHFDTKESIEIIRNVAEENYVNAAQGVYFKLRFERRPFTAYVRMIFPAVLINMVGFMAFWIQEAEESVALGVTSLLCSLAFRETVEMPDTAYVTWTEVFMIVNVSYQVSVMFIIWGSYGTAGFAGCVNRLCKCIHPRTVSKNIQEYRKRPLPTHKGLEIPENDLVVPMDLDVIDGGIEGIPQGTTFQFQPTRVKVNWQELRESQLLTHKGREIPANDLVAPINIDQIDGGLAGMAEGTYEVDVDEFQTEYDEETALKPSKPSSKKVSVRFNAGDSYSLHEDSNHSKPQVKFNNDFHDSWKSKESWKSNNSSIRHRRSSQEGPPRRGLQPKATTRFAKSMRRLADMYNNDKDREDGMTIDSWARHASNLDWIGRWIVVPSYFIVMATLVATGWGFVDEEYDSE